MYVLLPFCNPSQCKKRLCKYRNVQACWQSFRLLLSLSSHHLCLRSCRRWWFSAPILFIAILVFITMKWRAKYISSLSILRRKVSAILNEIATLKVQGILNLKCIFIVLKWEGSVHTEISGVQGRIYNADSLCNSRWSRNLCAYYMLLSTASVILLRKLFLSPSSACSGVAVWKD